jgi:fatty acid amide hydrolase 2
VSELFSTPAIELRCRLRRRELSPVELLDAHIARTVAVEPSINAIAEPRFEQARREARAAEAQISAAADPRDLPPLCGLPITVKEFIAIAGMRQTGGLLAARDHIAAADATVVERLRRAGAVIMATTNVPEGGMWIETHNRIYGRTRNPWSPAHTPGGSSGGEAALVAAGASPLGIGSDIGGSVRIPASFCGVTAHKATGRMIPNTGHWGPADHGTGPFLIIGPIARSVADLSLALPVIAGPDGVDRFCEPWALGDPGSVDPGELVVFTLPGFGGFELSPDVEAARDRAVAILRARGAEHRALELEGLRRAVGVWALAMEEAAGDAASFSAVLGGGAPIALGTEILRFVIGRGRFTIPALGLAVIEKLLARLPRRMLANVPPLASLRAEVSAALGGRGVIVHPTYTRPPPRHHHALFTPLHPVMTALFNVLEMPATQVPTGFSAAGLPLGVQVAGDLGNDHVCLAAAAAIEAEVGQLMPAPL